jgi:NADH dehydrogenase
VFAAGATTNDFGVPGVRELAFPLKKLDDALALRIHIIKVFEEVDANPSLIEKGALNFVVVGGGPTGVEMAGALQELISMVLHKDYPKLDTARARVILIESGGEVLSVFDAGLRGYALGALQKLGVDVRFNEAVVKVTDSEVQFKSGNAIPTRTVVWGAGIKANPLAQTLGVPLGRGGRVVVNDDLSIPGHANAFVIGDMAAGKDTQGGIYPQLATSAIRSGKHVARQIERKVRGEATQPFAYADPGFMATIGRNAAVAQFPNGAKFRGRLAWFMWVGLHLLQLIGLRNRMQVFINWVWNYLWMGYSGRIYGIERSSRFGGGGGGADVAASNAMTEPQPK